MTETKKKNGAKIALVVALVAAIAVIFAGVYHFFGPQTTEGAKEIVIEVIDNTEKSTSYTVHTDAEYLRQAMEEADGLEFSGTESEYGLMVDTVNGVTADYSVDASFWGFYLNGEMTNYGIDTQPVQDGEHYQIIYTISQ